MFAGAAYVYMNTGPDDSSDSVLVDAAYVYMNTDSSTPSPTLWMLRPKRGPSGIVFEVIGKGLGSSAGDRNAVVYFNGSPLTIDDFQIVAATASSPNLKIRSDAGIVNVEHTSIQVAVPDVADGEYQVSVEVD